MGEGCKMLDYSVFVSCKCLDTFLKTFAPFGYTIIAVNIQHGSIKNSSLLKGGFRLIF